MELDQLPEFSRMIHMMPVAELMDDQVFSTGPVDEQQLVVEAYGATGRATAPAGFLAANTDLFIIKTGRMGKLLQHRR